MTEGQSFKARQFLVDLAKRLAAQTNVRERVAVEDAHRISKLSEKHKVGCRENIWLYFIALPEVHHCLCQSFNLTEQEARLALGGEYFAKFQDYLGHNPYRQCGHALPKLKQGTHSTVQCWIKGANRFPLFQSYPDLAVIEPAPSRIVFDVKYFTGGDPEKALLEGIEEVVFYRGLPKTAEGGSLYDFGCLLAYDASDSGDLLRLWKSIEDKDHFWRSANLQPIILREGM